MQGTSPGPQVPLYTCTGPMVSTLEGFHCSVGSLQAAAVSFCLYTRDHRKFVFKAWL